MSFPMRIKPQFRIGLIGGSVFVLMIALFLAAQGTDPARYNAPADILRQMKALDADINQEAFRLRFGLQNSCDALNDKMTALMHLRTRLAASVNALETPMPREIQNALNAIAQTLAAKQEQSEQFKTSNAVLTNSRYYFPAICEFMRQRSASNAALPELTSELTRLEQDVLLYNLSGQTEMSSAALTDIRRLRAKQSLLKPEARDGMDSLLLHAAMFVQSKREADTHLARLIAVPSASNDDQFASLLERIRRSEFQIATVYRTAFFLVGLMVFIYAIGAFLKTRRQAHELHLANETLEGRVSERTHDLESANAELQQSEQRFRAIFANASIGIGQLALDGTMLHANAALCQTLGCTEETLDETVFAQFMETTDQERFRDKLASLQYRSLQDENDGTSAEETEYTEVRFARADGSERWGQVRVSLVRAENDTPLFFILLIQDTTSQKAAEQQIERLAYHDSLTGLPNRVAFMMQLQEALERAATKQQLTALMFIDCDNFKQINDTLGHEAGDEFLKQRAECMQNSLRPDDILARLGGDEFTILLENLPDEETALHIAKRVLKHLNIPMNLMGNEIFGGASIGIAFNRGDDVTTESMLRDADTAMYQIKTSGKGNCAIFEQDMNDRANEQMRIENGLRRALEKNELRVHYQPLIDLATGHMTGTEALVRWQHPEWGLIPPGKFIPIAESTGLIVPLGYWVLEEACRQTKQWQLQSPQYSSLMVNVNLSGHQLKRADIVEKIIEIVRKTDLPMHCLRLEITESVMMDNLEDASGKLNQLKEYGIKIALDDFGTGYSSMASLAELPLDSIKIDRSFVSRLGEQEQAGAAIAAIITLAKAHGLDVTGEGVETQDQMEMLQNYGCSLGQGYFFAKPLTADAMNSRLTNAETHLVLSKTAQESPVASKLPAPFTNTDAQQIEPAA